MFLNESLPLINTPDTHSGSYTIGGTAVAVLDTVGAARAAFGSCTTPDIPASCKVVYMLNGY